MAKKDIISAITQDWTDSVNFIEDLKDLMNGYLRTMASVQAANKTGEVEDIWLIDPVRFANIMTDIDEFSACIEHLNK